MSRRSRPSRPSWRRRSPISAPRRPRPKGRSSAEKDISASARAQAALLNQQLEALKARRWRKLNAALEAQPRNKTSIRRFRSPIWASASTRRWPARSRSSQRYRSEFFGRLREIIGDQPGIRIEGDRFVFQSELLFASGSADINDQGKAQLAELAKTLLEVIKLDPDRHQLGAAHRRPHRQGADQHASCSPRIGSFRPRARSRW